MDEINKKENNILPMQYPDSELSNDSCTVHEAVPMEVEIKLLGSPTDIAAACKSELLAPHGGSLPRSKSTSDSDANSSKTCEKLVQGGSASELMSEREKGNLQQLTR